MVSGSERQGLNPHREQSSESKVKDARRRMLPINGLAILIAVTALVVAIASSVILTRPGEPAIQEPTIQENMARVVQRAPHSHDSQMGHIGHLLL